VRAYFPKPDGGRLYQAVISLCSVAEFGDIAGSLRQQLAEARLQVLAKKFAAQLHSARRILHYLYSFDSGDLVEKPAAARVHEHEVSLHFEQLKDANLVG
jgi:hypothetical protein